MLSVVKKIIQKINIKFKKIILRLKWNHILSSKNTLNYTVSEAREHLNNLSSKPTVHNSVVLDKKIKKIETGKLSIIIPVYNVEKYIQECLDSIFVIPFEYPVEVICIDDGSKDSSGDILDDYARRYKEIKVIHQSNKGFSGARNVGIDKAKGEYLMFIDSDDIVIDNVINKLMNGIEGYDIIEGGHYFFDFIKFSTRKYNNEKVISDCKLRGQPWGKIFKAECFENIRFPEGYWYEDTILSFLVYPKYKNAYTIKDIVYGYRYNINGVTVKGVKNCKCIDSYWIVEEMIESLEKLNIKLDQKIYDKVIQQFGKILYSRIYYMDEETKECVFICAANFLEENFSGFETSKDGYWKYVEKSLKEQNYELWKSSCIMMM